ncbi:MAG: S8 family serine peptidase, partial [candidate division Zixibacteria bacterium]
NIIVTAVGNGINVVEAAGNGQENLDAAIYSVGNGGHWPFLSANNSGAIIVGAGSAPPAFGGSSTDRSRLWFSNYGSRLDLQGWGEDVYTTGYGDLYWVEGVDVWYTSSFGGTSSASPIVASAVAILEGIYEEASGGLTVTPAMMRSILIATGSPQQAGAYPISQHIGPRPNVLAAVAQLPSVSCCVNLTGNVNGDLADGVDISDLTKLVNHLFVTFESLPCPAEANTNGDLACGVDISDLTKLVNHLFVTFEALAACNPACK